MRLKRNLTFGKWDVPERRRFIAVWRNLTAPQLFVGSFLALIAAGTLGLRYLPHLHVGEPLGWLDALFTATSAVCVTAHLVVDTATHFTFAGQAFLLLLIQLGGLGMLAFTTLIIVALGRRLSLRQEALSTGSLDVAPHIEPRRMALDVVRFTLLIEAAGAVALYLLWAPRYGWYDAIWPSVFHSVSSFCNAGFTIFPENMVRFQDSPATLTVIMILVVTGGLGFLTLEEIYLRYYAGRRQQIFRLSLHTRIVLVTTAILLVAGWLLFALFEWDGALGELPWYHKLTNALFMSVTCRTAGYNSIDYSTASNSTNFLTIVLMMIGGSPGSTAGGIKTTTVALIGLLALSRLRGIETTTFWQRSVREETTDRAIGLFVIAFGIVTAGIFLITATESHGAAEDQFLAQMFEAVSAFSTVGISMGLTAEMSTPGKITLILLMFLGRVGPLTIAAAITLRSRFSSDFRYAYEDVVVG